MRGRIVGGPRWYQSRQLRGGGKAGGSQCTGSLLESEFGASGNEARQLRETAKSARRQWRGMAMRRCVAGRTVMPKVDLSQGISVENACASASIAFRLGAGSTLVIATNVPLDRPLGNAWA